MERKVFLTALVVLIFALFVGCGSKSEKAPAEGNDTENVELPVSSDKNDIANTNDIFETAENMNKDAIDAAEKMIGGLSKGATNEMRKAQEDAAEEMRKAQKEAAEEMRKAQKGAAEEMRKAMEM
ncbi:MAG: hypothetical protein J6Q22_12155 [Prevotella sp.]|nr:hypothetical protein [Prevotella sp.]